MVNGLVVMGTVTETRLKTRQNIRNEKHQLEELLSTLHFDHIEVEDIRDSFKNLANYKVKKRKFISTDRIKEIFWAWFDMHDEVIVDELLKHVEPFIKKYLTEIGWIKLLSLMLRGTLDERITFCFKKYDIYKRGYISRNLAEEYIQQTFIPVDEDEEQDVLADDMVSYIFNRLDYDKDGLISEDDFRNGVTELPDLLECFGKIFPSEETLKAVEFIIFKSKEINV